MLKQLVQTISYVVHKHKFLLVNTWKPLASKHKTNLLKLFFDISILHYFLLTSLIFKTIKHVTGKVKKTLDN